MRQATYLQRRLARYDFATARLMELQVARYDAATRRLSASVHIDPSYAGGRDGVRGFFGPILADVMVAATVLGLEGDVAPVLISQTMDYFGEAPAGDYLIEAWLLSLGEALCTVRARLHQGGDMLAAGAMGVLVLEGASR